MALKDQPSLASWIRDVALGEKPKRPVNKTDPALLYELNKIGINLNQIARVINKKEEAFERFDLLLQLQNISEALQEILDNAR